MTAATITRPGPRSTAPTLQSRRGDVADQPVLTLGIDIGGTKTACVVTDEDDTILYRDVTATEPGRLAEQVVEVAGRAIASMDGTGAEDVSTGRVAAIGVALPGQVEPRSGATHLAVNLGGGDADLRTKVESATGLPCFLEHDARAAATWVYERGDTDADDRADLCYLSLGTGIAAGIVLGGRALKGETGLAGEVGHAFAEAGGPTCACGLSGCLETVAAGPAIARQAREAVTRGESTTLGADARAGDVFAAAAAGDAVAERIIGGVSVHLARAIRGLVLTLGVRRVVIGGGVAANGNSLLKPLMDAIAAERSRSRLVESVFADTTVKVLEPGLDPGARGAAFIARRALSGAQTSQTRTTAARREGVGDR